MSKHRSIRTLIIKIIKEVPIETSRTRNHSDDTQHKHCANWYKLRDDERQAGFLEITTNNVFLTKLWHVAHQWTEIEILSEARLVQQCVSGVLSSVQNVIPMANSQCEGTVSETPASIPMMKEDSQDTFNLVNDGAKHRPQSRNLVYHQIDVRHRVFHRVHRVLRLKTGE